MHTYIINVNVYNNISKYIAFAFYIEVISYFLQCLSDDRSDSL